jgi:hypothetical protein
MRSRAARAVTRSASTQLRLCIADTERGITTFGTNGTLISSDIRVVPFLWTCPSWAVCWA